MSLSQTFSTRLPSFQQFKKLNSIILKPPPYKNPSQSLEPLPKNQNQIKSKKHNSKKDFQFNSVFFLLFFSLLLY